MAGLLALAAAAPSDDGTLLEVLAVAPPWSEDFFGTFLVVLVVPPLEVVS